MGRACETHRKPASMLGFAIETVKVFKAPSGLKNSHCNRIKK